MLPRKASAKARRPAGRTARKASVVRTARRPRSPQSARSALEAWGKGQGWGWKTRLQQRTWEQRVNDEPVVAWSTIYRAIRGIKVNLSTALRLSKATGGAVPYESLTDERVEREVA